MIYEKYVIYVSSMLLENAGGILVGTLEGIWSDDEMLQCTVPAFSGIESYAMQEDFLWGKLDLAISLSRFWRFFAESETPYSILLTNIKFSLTGRGSEHLDAANVGCYEFLDEGRG